VVLLTGLEHRPGISSTGFSDPSKSQVGLVAFSARFRLLLQSKLRGNRAQEIDHDRLMPILPPEVFPTELRLDPRELLSSTMGVALSVSMFFFQAEDGIRDHSR